MTKLIGLNGTMGCGKSEAFKAIKAYAGNRETVLVKFAQPLYDMQELIYDRIKSVYSRPDTFIKDRKLLQWLGTDWGRDTISTNLWVDIWKTEVERNIAKGALVVCDDVRFDNEASVVKAMGGTIVRIISNRTAERIDTNAGIKSHASEAGIAHEFVDIFMENNTSLEDYKGSLSLLCRKLGISDSTPSEYVESAQSQIERGNQ